jgi:hypothetical protein
MSSKFAGLAQAKMNALEGEEKKEEKSSGNKTSKQVSKLAIKQANNKASKQSSNIDEADLVGITIKVPEAKRIWWNVQAKLQKTTLRDAIITALEKRFGEPKDL